MRLQREEETTKHNQKETTVEELQEDKVLKTQKSLETLDISSKQHKIMENCQ